MSETRATRWLAWCLFGNALFLPVSIALSEPLAYAAAPLILWLAWHRDLPSDGRNPYRWPMLAFVLVAALSMFWSIRPGLTAGKLDRFLLLGVVLALPLMGRRERAGGVDWAGRLVLLFLIGASLQALMDVVVIPWSYLHATSAHDALVKAGELSRRARRPTLFDMGNMRDPQMYMVSLSLLAGWWLYRRRDAVTRWWWAAAVLNTAAFLLHFKRGAWLAFLASSAVMAVAARRRRMLLVLLLAAAGALAVPQVRARLQLLQEEFRVQTGGRFALWTQIAPRMWEEHPLGLGWKAARHEDFTRYEVRLQPKLNHLHNNLMQVRLELGWAGLAVWIFWMGLAGVVMWRTFRVFMSQGGPWAGLSYGVLGGFLALQLNGLVEYNFGDSEIFMLLNFLLGLSALAWLEARPGSPPAAGPAS